MAKMVDLREHDGRYYFRVAGGDGFWDTVKLLKNTFGSHERDFDDDTKEWSVLATEVNEVKLAVVFSNAKSIFEYLHAQLPLL